LDGEQGLGGGGERAMVGNGKKGLQLFDVHTVLVAPSTGRGYH
jgi:hypothetical protein